MQQNVLKAPVKKLGKNARKSLMGLCFLLLALWAARLNSELRELDPPGVTPAPEISQSLHPKAALVLSLGHVPALVDSLLIRALSETSLDPVAPNTRAPVFFLMDLATQLDPHYFELYWVSASLLSIVYRDGVGAGILLDRAHEVLEKGDFPSESFQTRYWAYAWQLEMMRGYNALFELGDLKRAREAFQLSAKLPGSMSFLENISKRLDTREGRIEIVSKTLEGLLQRRNDPVVQRELEDRARVARLARFLDQTEREYVQSREAFFEKFLSSRGIVKDPEGGTLSWNATTKQIETTTGLTGLSVLYP